MEKIKFKKTRILELNDAYLKVMCWFFSYPTQEISLNDLVELVNISKTTAKKVVNRLLKEEFLARDILGRMWRIKCNQKHPFNMTRKIAYNLQLIYESGIIDGILNSISNPRSMILFGSYRKGDDTENSDIDIAVETLDDEEVKIENVGIIPSLGYRKDVKVNILKFSRNKIDLNLFTNIANGIVLYGLLEVHP